AAQVMTDERSQVVALREAARALALVGEHERARAAAREIQHWPTLISTLVRVGQAMARAHEFNQARALVENDLGNYEDAPQRWEVLSEIALALAQTRQGEEAMKTLKAIDHQGRRARALSQVSAALAQAREFDWAITAAESIDDEPWKSATLGNV